jgi:CubicO group peptidase (beta-lactamase class C family)
MTNLCLSRLAALLCLAGAAQAQPPQAFIEAADKSVPGALRAYNVPGLAVALIRNGAVVWMKGYGFADVASAKPIAPDTAFNVGSLSKTATAWGVMRLVERGKVELDQPVDAYLRGWRLPPSEFDAKQVTIRRVLSHTAGTTVITDGTRHLPSLPSSTRSPGRPGQAQYGWSLRPARALLTRARTMPSCNS